MGCSKGFQIQGCASTEDVVSGLHKQFHGSSILTSRVSLTGPSFPQSWAAIGGEKFKQFSTYSSLNRNCYIPCSPYISALFTLPPYVWSISAWWRFPCSHLRQKKQFLDGPKEVGWRLWRHQWLCWSPNMAGWWCLRGWLFLSWEPGKLDPFGHESFLEKGRLSTKQIKLWRWLTNLWV